MPRVTVIIATYNWSTVLPYSIGSVLDQTFEDFELLVIGDHCSDDSEEVVRAIADPRVRWINLETRAGHQFGPNNEGLRQARGEIIAYLGHDDLWFSRHLEFLVEAIDNGADLAHSLVGLVSPPRRGNEATITLAAPQWRPPSSVAHRRAVTESVGGWRDYREIRATPEGDLWQRIAAAGFRIALVTRLTALKFPATWRRDVYHQRPFDEQASWLMRIRSEPDLEAVELARIAARAKPSFIERFLRLAKMPSQWIPFVSRRRGARVRAWQRFKGARH